MNIISLALDLTKILQEQISIINSIISLNQSIRKLIDQKELSKRWVDSDLLLKPEFLFKEAINSKAEVIRKELLKLRYSPNYYISLLIFIQI